MSMQERIIQDLWEYEKPKNALVHLYLKPSAKENEYIEVFEEDIWRYEEEKMDMTNFEY